MHDVLCKSLGSSNAINVARATINGLQSLQRPEDVAARRGLAAEDFVPKGMLNAYNERKKQMSSGGGALMAQTQRQPITRDAVGGTLTVTQVRSTIANKPKTRGTMTRARAAQDRRHQRPARPPGDPRHARTRAAPRLRGRELNIEK